MTEKRFRSGLAKYDEFSDEIIDELTGKHYFDSTKDDYVFSEEIVDLLNDLTEENEQLRFENNELKCALALDNIDYILADGKKIDIPPYYEFENRYKNKKYRREEYDEY